MLVVTTWTVAKNSNRAPRGKITSLRFKYNDQSDRSKRMLHSNIIATTAHSKVLTGSPIFSVREVSGRASSYSRS